MRNHVLLRAPTSTQMGCDRPCLDMRYLSCAATSPSISSRPRSSRFLVVSYTLALHLVSGVHRLRAIAVPGCDRNSPASAADSMDRPGVSHMASRNSHTQIAHMTVTCLQMESLVCAARTPARKRRLRTRTKLPQPLPCVASQRPEYQRSSGGRQRQT